MAAVDIKSAEALANDAARAFSEGLKGLTARALAEADDERQRLVVEERKLSEGRTGLEAERRCLKELRAHLNEEKRHLEQGFARLAQERAELESMQAQRSAGKTPSFGAREIPTTSSCRDTPDGVRDVCRGNESPVATCSLESEGVLSRCENEVLATVFSGRSSPMAGCAGRILVDFKPALLRPALEQLTNSQDVPVSAHGPELERRFLHLLAQHGVQGWVYHQICEDLVDSIVVRGRRYSVLPSAGPEEASVLLDMYDSIVTVPPGWEVMSTAQDGFNDVIQELASHGWGTSLLCVKNKEGGFSSYRTALYTHGAAAGTRVSADSRVLQVVDDRGTEFKFSKGMVLSGRLVICMSRGGHGRNKL